MIVFIYGTTAEAIKVAPVVRRLEQRGIAYEQWVTLQHTKALLDILPGLGLREPDRVIANGVKGEPLRSAKDVFPWVLQALNWLRKHRRALRRDLPANTVIVVHGDTMTSVLGSWIAKRLGKPIAHIEAGLRSGNWRHPFPEELDRRIVGRMATVHYAPSEESVENLAGERGVVHTHGNTVLDAVLDQVDGAAVRGDYGVALLHRFEFLANKELVESTMTALAASTTMPIKFFVDEYAKETIADSLASDYGDNLVVQNKLEHAEFVECLRNAQFVVTDSGGIQAEAALLGVPTLVHRKATEQREGFGRNILLSEWKVSAVVEFLRDFEDYRHPPQTPEHSPSDIIVEDLVARGFADTAAAR